jgi:aminopeptidase-like protein
MIDSYGSAGMPFVRCREPATTAALVDEAWRLMTELYPVCRSITGAGLRQTLAQLSTVQPLEIVEVPSGTPVFDWEVPHEWNVREAWIKDGNGRTVIDLRDHSLHVLNYSAPVRAKLTLDELRPHLYSRPDMPDVIPYRTSYYEERWGFCMAHRQLEGLQAGTYDVCIDSSLDASGSLTYGECFVAGAVEDEFLVFTHVCHPSLCNDNLTGMALAALLAREVAASRPRLSYRFVFAPGTIGSIAWLSRNERNLHRIRHGLVLGLLGDRGPLTYKRSRRGDAEIDAIADAALAGIDPGARVVPFSPYGYDERQLCSPGFNLPVGRLTRTPNNEYPEYHTSADDFSLLDRAALAQSLHACAEILAMAERDEFFVNTNPKCEPRLGKRGLFRNVGGRHPGQFEHALLWVLNQADGENSVLAIARRAGLPFATVVAAVDALRGVGLLKRVERSVAR